MTTFVFIPGAGSTPWFWHLVDAELRARDHDTVAVDLPNDDDSAGLAEYADVVVAAIGDRTDLVLVAHSLGGFTAPLVCERVPVKLMVLVSGMIPAPGEPPGEWWGNTGHEAARREQDERDDREPDDVVGLFLHDVPPDLVAEAPKHSRDQSGTPFEKPWPLTAWPDVPTTFLLCRDDRFFPSGFMRRVVRERLGITPDEMGGGHSAPLSRPKELAERLDAYAAEVCGPGGGNPGRR